MSEPLDELYFRWLYSQVGLLKTKDPKKTYWSLLKLLHQKEFVWFVPNDDNRLEDGRDLRNQLIIDEDLTNLDDEWMNLGCSMLEMLVALSNKCAFEGGRTTRHWFWKLMENLGLRECTDSSGFIHSDVDDILNEVIWRTYEADGHGGLFPLKHPKKDQRGVEIWYQMCAYILEND